MDLKGIRDQIKNITDFSPDLQAYSNQLDHLINQAYFRLWTSKRWLFAQKLTWLEAYPDITSGRETMGVGPAITASYNDGQRLVTFSASVYTLENKKHIYEGNIIQLKSREYTILQILSSTQLTVSEPIRIEDGVGSVTDDEDWIVKARFYTLPEDCIEILNLQHRDVPVGSGGNGTILPPYGKTVALMPRFEEEMGLREDYTQTYAECYVPIPPHNVPPGEKLSATFVAPEANQEGNIPQSKYFEICWSLISPDKQTGPLSDSIIIKSPTNPQAPNQTYYLNVNFLTWDDKPYQSKNTTYTAGPGTARPLESLRKILWYNQNFNPATGERLGLPKWRQITVGPRGVAGAPPQNLAVQDDPIVVADTVSTVSVVRIESFDPGTKIYREYDGHHIRIRPYPRIDAFDFQYEQAATLTTVPKRLRDFFRRLELRYYYKPMPLAAQTDTPELPYEMHQTIVHLVLEDVYNKAGNLQLAQLYARKAAGSLKELEKRYVDHADVTVRKGQFQTLRWGPMYDQNSLRNKSL